MPIIRHEINILNETYNSGTVTNPTLAKAQLDLTQYSGTVTVYAEYVAKNINATTAYDVAVLFSGDSVKGETVVPQNTTAWTRFRSTAITLATLIQDVQTYSDVTASAGDIQVKSCRLIIIQDSSTLTASETQIEIGMKKTGLTSTTSTKVVPDATLTKYWKYTAANWDGTKTFFAEVTYLMASSKSSGTFVLQEDNGSFASWADKVTIVDAGIASAATRVRSVAFTPVDGRNYRIAYLVASSKSAATIFNAKIIVDQINTARGLKLNGTSNKNLSGGSGTNEQAAQDFIMDMNNTVTGVKFYLKKTGTPSDDLVFDITSTLGGSSLASGSIPASSLTTTSTQYTINFGTPVALNASTLYYIQISRSGARDTTNNYQIQYGTDAYGGFYSKDSGVWGAEQSTIAFNFIVLGENGITLLEPQYLLLNTADAGGTINQDFDTLWDSSEWASVTNVYKHAMDSDNASNSADLVDIDNSDTQLTNSSVTGANQQISAAITMPTTGHQIDTDIDNTTGVVAASRILVATTVVTSTDLSINKSESITVTESTSLLVPELYKNVSDSITVTENKPVELNSFVNKSDSITATEAVNLTLTNNINVSDSVTITENLKLLNEANINKSDSVTITENSVVLLPQLYVSVSDSVTIAENVQRLLESYINKSDSVTVTENVQRELNSFVNKSDSVTITEDLKLLSEEYINKSDTITVTENAVVSIDSGVVDLTVSVSDSVTITESVQRMLESRVSVSDSATITESVARQLLSFINKGDTVTVTEAVQRQLLSFINVSDDTVVGESILVQHSGSTTLNINVNDSITLTESVSLLQEGGSNPASLLLLGVS